LFQRPQAQRQRARADPLQRALQLAEAAAPRCQVTDDQERPLAADDVGGAADRTAGIALSTHLRHIRGEPDLHWKSARYSEFSAKASFSEVLVGLGSGS